MRLLPLLAAALLLAPAAPAVGLLSVPFDGPASVVVQDVEVYTGRVLAADGAGLPGVRVDVLRDGVVVASEITSVTGGFSHVAGFPTLGTVRLRAVALPGTAAEASSEEVAVAVADRDATPLRVEVARLRTCATSGPCASDGPHEETTGPANGRYDVVVTVAGRLVDEDRLPVAGATVTGEVTQLADCPEGYACAAVVEIVGFSATTAEDGSFTVDVGPFEAEYPPEPGLCVDDVYRVDAASGAHEATATGVVHACAGVA